MKFKALCAVAFLLAAGVAAQTVVDQGAPGNQGPWPITCVSGCAATVVFDGGITFSGGSLAVTGIDGGPVPVDVVRSIALQVFTDGGFVGSTSTQPCSRIVHINDAGYSTTPTRVPASGPTAGRIWIRVCNSTLNSSSTICTCATDSCPSSVAASVQGDVLATSDCVTYPLGVADAGVPCCVCNGAGSFLPSAECVP